MRILLDENLLSKKLKKPLSDSGHAVSNVDDMGWRGTKDKPLLALAEASGFDVFITADKNLPYEQNLRGLALRVVVLNANSTRPDALLPLISGICNQLESLEIGSIVLIDDDGKIKKFEF